LHREAPRSKLTCETLLVQVYPTKSPIHSAARRTEDVIDAMASLLMIRPVCCEGPSLTTPSWTLKKQCDFVSPVIQDLLFIPRTAKYPRRQLVDNSWTLELQCKVSARSSGRCQKSTAGGSCKLQRTLQQLLASRAGYSDLGGNLQNPFSALKKPEHMRFLENLCTQGHRLPCCDHGVRSDTDRIFDHVVAFTTLAPISRASTFAFVHSMRSRVFQIVSTFRLMMLPDKLRCFPGENSTSLWTMVFCSNSKCTTS
jgi:hypothetical protein